jgi:hypothetical protein
VPQYDLVPSPVLEVAVSSRVVDMHLHPDQGPHPHGSVLSLVAFKIQGGKIIYENRKKLRIFMF